MYFLWFCEEPIDNFLIVESSIEREINIECGYSFDEVINIIK